MAKFKAIEITEANKLMLCDQFGMDEDYLDDSVGMSIVSGFGDESLYYGVIDRERLESDYEKTGKLLRNDWYEVSSDD